ncbi:MAG TPA: lytic murein transglycosylase [Gaiellaceae bacterium]|nr:lytic murein transglycosylase [Gaiellaceae bacterium]
MRKLLAVCALVLALGAGSASADTFAVVPDEPVWAPALPSAEEPNQPGGLLLPPSVFDAPFLPVIELSYEELQSLWLRAGSAYGIPWQVLASINKIESDFGRNMGPSSAGAVGWMQFMPDTWLRWGVDASGDGIADPWNAEDAVHAAARYLAAAEGRTDISRAIFAYNHAQWYVDDVLQLAALFGGGGDADVVFDLDRMALGLEEAQQQVASLSDELAAAEAHAAELAPVADQRAAEADDIDVLLSDRLAAEQVAFQADQELLAATAEVDRLRTALEAAEAGLEAARSGVHASSFLPAAAGVLGMPSRSDGYVFPVGGGADVVSVGHDHHDYAAADIAAPMGAPVFVLADSVVLNVVDDGQCGTGFTLRSLDGLEWIYCHLSHRDTSVQPGVLLPAGHWAGLVGSTGHSTGPHLHLGLNPARYPQEMPWFQEFAGIAFTWQDGPAEQSARTAPIFSVVPPAEPAEDVVEFTLAGG